MNSLKVMDGRWWVVGGGDCFFDLLNPSWVHQVGSYVGFPRL